MGTQYQPFSLLYLNGHDLVGAKTVIRRQHFQHEPRWAGETVITKDIDEAFIRFVKMV